MPADVTLADVAAAAGVNASTVSRTLSRPEMVSAATLDRVTRAVDRLGYVPNRAARQLAGGRTGALGILVPDITNPFFAGIVRAAQRAASDQGQVALLADAGARPAAEVAAIRSLVDGVDGVVACSPTAPISQLVDAAAGRPVVLVNRRGRGVTSVAVDQAAIVARAFEHLTGAGHRRLAMVAGPSAYWSSPQRRRALDRVSTVGDLDGPPVEVTVLDGHAPTFEGGRGCVDELLASGVTGVLAFNDLVALGIASGVQERGLVVPDDLSVVGSDDVPFAAMATPPLTTVQSPVDHLGAMAVESLASCIAGSPPAYHELEPRLVERRSTAPPPGVAPSRRTHPPAPAPGGSLSGDR